MEKELQALRDQIDAIDDELIALLKQRIGIVKQVGALKDSHELRACHARPGREGRMQRRIFNAFNGSDFHPLAATAMWRQIIGASTHLESPLKIATLSLDTHDTLYWHSRAYFGFFSSVSCEENAEQVLEIVRKGEASIAVLPLDAAEQWHTLLAEERFADLKIFAHIPFVKRQDSRMQPFALAIANVPMEESDADISCFVDASGAYKEVEGFKTGLEGATYIGTYPTPVEYSE